MSIRSKAYSGARWAALGLLGVLVGCNGDADTDGGSAGTNGRPPDIILIVVDTLRADAVFDPLGNFETPAFDRLKRDGVPFRRAFAHAPMTLPSHTAMFSSRPPFETGVLNNGQPIDEDLPLLAEHLDELGYDTRAVLSLGTLHARPDGGIQRGFDAYDTRFPNLAQGPDVFARALDVLDGRDEDEPLFFFAHFSDPHAPYNDHGAPPLPVEVKLDGALLDSIDVAHLDSIETTFRLSPGEHEITMDPGHEIHLRQFDLLMGGEPVEIEFAEGRMVKRSTKVRITFRVPGDGDAELSLKLWATEGIDYKETRRRYATEVEFVDGFVGQLIEELEARGIWDEALVVFTSDHGEALGEHGYAGHVQCLHDHCLRVPLILKAPASTTLPEHIRERVNRVAPQVDVVPTMLDIAGLAPLPGARGSSWLEGGTSLLIAETHAPEAVKSQICVRDERYKLIFFIEDDRFVLYDLETDPFELTNVFEAQGGEREEWQSHLRRLAEAAERSTTSGGPIDPETARMLKALGY